MCARVRPLGVRSGTENFTRVATDALRQDRPRRVQGVQWHAYFLSKKTR